MSIPAGVQKTSSLLDSIGNTPLIRLRRALPQEVSPLLEIYAKAEWFNPGGSVKDRPAYFMVRKGRESGAFKPGQTLIDSTSGNTGIAYAMIGAVMGFSVELVMPGNVSSERKQIVTAYGAAITYSDPLKGSDGAREVAAEIAAREPRKYFYPDQYSNPENWRAHYETTGPEIWRDTQGRITHFVSGLGTSGTMMGTARFLKEKNSEIQTIALQPEAFHGIEGWKNMDSSSPVPIYDSSVYDRKITIPTEPAYYWATELVRKEGLLVSPSAGGVLYGALHALEGVREGMAVLMFADGGEKYLSTHLAAL
ncbi:MAG: cysteine synthase family protein [Candidatus Omnitrophota bacterium]|nr:cysteine synthase family protein [Candidatus Omnitrophota bacterium]